MKSFHTFLGNTVNRLFSSAFNFRPLVKSTKIKRTKYKLGRKNELMELKFLYYAFALLYVWQIVCLFLNWIVNATSCFVYSFREIQHFYPFNSIFTGPVKKRVFITFSTQSLIFILGSKVWNIKGAEIKRFTVFLYTFNMNGRLYCRIGHESAFSVNVNKGELFLGQIGKKATSIIILEQIIAWYRRKFQFCIILKYIVCGMFYMPYWCNWPNGEPERTKIAILGQLLDNYIWVASGAITSIWHIK